MKIKCLVFITTAVIKENRRSKPPRKRNQDTVAVVVKEEGKSYANLLEMIKERLIPGSIAPKA